MTNARLGAVSYLNMLPYFHEGNVRVFETPRALNNAARAGEVDAACMSAIAGLRAGFRPLVPAFGIGARAEVRSVFVEPVPFSAAEEAFWRAWERGLSCSEEVVLWTSGASEHSEWLACTLLEEAGARVEVVVDPELERLPAAEFRRRLELQRRGRPVAALFIGDPALSRARLAPHTFRVDLGLAWNAFSGLPCVFAAWFACTPANPMQGTTEVFQTALNSWEALGPTGRREAIARFFPSLPEAPLSAGDLSDLQTYLEGISFTFDAAFVRTLSEYERLLAAQQSQERRVRVAFHSVAAELNS